MPHSTGARRWSSLRNPKVEALIDEIRARGAERAEINVERVLRELAKIGFSDIRKAVAWRNEMIAHEDDEGEDGEGVVRTTRVLEPRVSLVPSKELDDDTGKAIAEVSQTVNGALRIKMHDKHAALVSIGKHLGMFVDGRWGMEEIARVTITDRGPYVKGRCIDLSQAGARALGFAGLAPVSVVPVMSD
jgi:hypothetical protein